MFGTSDLDPAYMLIGAAPTVEPLGGQMTSVPPTFDELVAEWTDDDLDVLWRCGGFESEHGPRPHRREVAVLTMVSAVTRHARRALARLFASLSPARLFAALAPHCLARAVAALLRQMAYGTSRTPRAMTARSVRRMLSQAGHGAVMPTRGSPTFAAHVCPVTPGDPPM